MFTGCDSLTYIVVDKDNTKYHSKDNCLIETATNILVSGCKNSIIPDYVTLIGDYAFADCDPLESITIPNSVTSIGVCAFNGCRNLTSVEIPNSVTSIGERAFDSCYNLTNVTIGKAVTSIEYDAFSGCYKLVEVWNKSKLNITKASNSNGYVGYYALDVYKNKADKKIFTDGKGYVFYEGANECYLIRYTGKGTVLNLPTSCHGKNYAIYKYAFDHCNKLTNVTIPNSVTSIEDNAFSGCSKLKSIVIGSGVTFIGNDAFWNCSKLTNIHYNGTKEQWFFVVQNEPWDFEKPRHMFVVLTRT